jgi:hypothetical protein
LRIERKDREMKKKLESIKLGIYRATMAVRGANNLQIQSSSQPIKCLILSPLGPYIQMLESRPIGTLNKKK